MNQKEEKIEKGKKDVQELLKEIFEVYKDIKTQNIDRVEYKISIYNSPNWLESNIDNVEYSDLLGCMLDIEEEFEDIKQFMDNVLIAVKEFKKEYFENYEDTEEYKENEEECEI